MMQESNAAPAIPVAKPQDVQTRILSEKLAVEDFTHPYSCIIESQFPDHRDELIALGLRMYYRYDVEYDDLLAYNLMMYGEEKVNTVFYTSANLEFIHFHLICVAIAKFLGLPAGSKSWEENEQIAPLYKEGILPSYSEYVSGSVTTTKSPSKHSTLIGSMFKGIKKHDTIPSHYDSYASADPGPPKRPLHPSTFIPASQMMINGTQSNINGIIPVDKLPGSSSITPKAFEFPPGVTFSRNLFAEPDDEVVLKPINWTQLIAADKEFMQELTDANIYDVEGFITKFKMNCGSKLKRIKGYSKEELLQRGYSTNSYGSVMLTERDKDVMLSIINMGKDYYRAKKWQIV